MTVRTCFALLLVAGSPLGAAEPQATFAVVKGCLEVRIEQDTIGIEGARVRVVDLAAQPIAELECNERGECWFPLPARSGYLVGVTIPGKKKESDIITLRREGKSVVPPRVLLSFSKPCCRVVFSSRPVAESTPEAEPSRPEKPSIAWIVLGVSGSCMLAAGMMLMFFRRS